MPLWAFMPLILVAVVACPLSMWVMGKVMRRTSTCPMCQMGAGRGHQHSLEILEARRVTVEREIAQLRTSIEQDTENEAMSAKAHKG